MRSLFLLQLSFYSIFLSLFVSTSIWVSRISLFALFLFADSVSAPAGSGSQGQGDEDGSGDDDKAKAAAAAAAAMAAATVAGLEADKKQQQELIDELQAEMDKLKKAYAAEIAILQEHVGELESKLAAVEVVLTSLFLSPSLFLLLSSPFAAVCRMSSDRGDVTRMWRGRSCLKSGSGCRRLLSSCSTRTRSSTASTLSTARRCELHVCTCSSTLSSSYAY